LAPGWLVDVEKKLHRLNHHKSFRIFMTMEFNPKIPNTLLRMSVIQVFEPPSGIKASLLRTYGSIVTPQRSEKAPKERCRMHFLLSWFHAVVQERLRFTPIGWSKRYEFNESDQRGSLDAVDEWITKSTKEMSDNIDPQSIPWDAIRTLLSEAIYGGKIDNEYDQKILNSLTEQFFTPKSFESNFALFKVPSTSDVLPLISPEGRKVADYKKWIEELPNVESPLWCGLPVNVDNILKKRQTLNLVENFKHLQGIEDEEASGVDTDKNEKGAFWLQRLNEKVTSLLGFLPASLPQLHREEESLTDPLFRFLEREVILGGKLLTIVKQDLLDLKLMSTGDQKATNELREISRELDTDCIPSKWRKYKVANITATEWVIDFVKRLAQLELFSEDSDYKSKKLWLGGFFFPEALITATRQKVAENHKWSLEELDLVVKIGKDSIEDDQSFMLEGLTLEGYEWSTKNNDVLASDVLSAKLPTTTIKWVHVDHKDDMPDSDKVTQLPVYLNNERLNLLFSVKIVSEQPRTDLYQRGIALVSWSTG
jgi:dynein heavy chain 1